MNPRGLEGRIDGRQRSTQYNSGSYSPRSSNKYDYNNMPNFSGKNKAEDSRAWLARAEWADYQNRFAPYEKKLLNEVSQDSANREMYQRLGQINADTNKSYRSFAGAEQRSNQRYGVSKGRNEAISDTRNMGINKALSKVDAINRTSANIAERNTNIIGGTGSSTNRSQLTGV